MGRDTCSTFPTGASRHSEEQHSSIWQYERHSAEQYLAEWHSEIFTFTRMTLSRARYSAKTPYRMTLIRKEHNGIKQSTTQHINTKQNDIHQNKTLGRWVEHFLAQQYLTEWHSSQKIVMPLCRKKHNDIHQYFVQQSICQRDNIQQNGTSHNDFQQSKTQQSELIRMTLIRTVHKL